MNKFNGFEPLVYLLRIQGKIICIGIKGTVRKAKVSLDIPASVSFKGVPESVIAKAILQVSRISANDWILLSFNILMSII